MSNWNPGFPLYINVDGMELPKEGTYFVVAGNGCWMHKDTGIIRGFVPVPTISFLEDLDAQVQLEVRLPKIPAKLISRTQEFFRRVVDEHRSESEVNLLFNSETDSYMIHVPRQQVSHSGVKYNRAATVHKPELEGYRRVGTIHSHCDFSAFHSHTDIGDEEDFDGIHITFGHNDCEEFSISACVVINGNRGPIDPMAMIDGITPVGEEEGNEPKHQSEIKVHYGTKTKPEKRYRMVAGPNQREQWNVGLEAWMGLVKKEQYSWSNYGSNTSDAIKVGTVVGWRRECCNGPAATACGLGPFVVTAVEGSMISFEAPQGLVSLSSQFFIKTEIERDEIYEKI